MKPEQKQRLVAQRAALEHELQERPEAERDPVRLMIKKIDRLLAEKPQPREPKPDPEGMQQIASAKLSKGRELRVMTRERDGQAELHLRVYRRHVSGQMERTRNGMRLKPAMLPALIDALSLAQQHVPTKVKP